jgi:hypothetical protein
MLNKTVLIYFYHGQSYNMTAKIYNFNKHIENKDDALRRSYGYTKETWSLMKENGYNINDPEDIDQFFWDLEEE